MAIASSVCSRSPLLASGCVLSVLFMAGCAEMPSGPTIAVMPGPNKPFEVFLQDEQLCRNWAEQSIGLPGNNIPRDQLLRSLLAGAVIGAAAGALLGGHHQADAGAAMGTVMGAAAGSGAGNMSAWRAQRQYDIAYQQCMYAKGNHVPAYESASYRNVAPPPPPPAPLPR